MESCYTLKKDKYMHVVMCFCNFFAVTCFAHSQSTNFCFTALQKTNQLKTILFQLVSSKRSAMKRRVMSYFFKKGQIDTCWVEMYLYSDMFDPIRVRKKPQEIMLNFGNWITYINQMYTPFDRLILFIG